MGRIVREIPTRSLFGNRDHTVTPSPHCDLCCILKLIHAREHLRTCRFHVVAESNADIGVSEDRLDGFIRYAQVVQIGSQAASSGMELVAQLFKFEQASVVTRFQSNEASNPNFAENSCSATEHENVSRSVGNPDVDLFSQMPV